MNRCRTTLLLALAPAALLFAGCEATQVSDADVRVIEAGAVQRAADDEQTVLVDVRQPEDYAAGHIPGAVNIFLPVIRRQDPRLAGAQRIIVYATNRGDPLAMAAAKKMLSLGYQNVRLFHGGIDVWTDEGGQLAESVPPQQQRPESETQPQQTTP